MQLVVIWLFDWDYEAQTLQGLLVSLGQQCYGDVLQMIQNGISEILVTGGSEAAMTGMGISAFQNMKALSRRNDEPARASRPFDVDRDGFVLSEGAGILIFEELEHALARNAKIYCEVIGYGASCDAGHITQPDPAGMGASKAMQNALDDANLAPEDVQYLNAHGTSTPLGDKAETQAVKGVFGEHAYNLNISSTKSSSATGASGGIELVITAKAIENQEIPPTINLTRIRTGISITPTPQSKHHHRCEKKPCLYC